MTTPLPSCSWNAGDTAFDAGNYNFASGSGSPFAALKENPELYDKFFADVGPRTPDGATNYFLEFHQRWWSSGQSDSLTTGANSLRSQYLALRGLGKGVGDIIHYLGGIHYSVSINANFWNTKLYSIGGSTGRRLIRGASSGGMSGAQMAVYLRGMLSYLLDSGSPICDLCVDGTGLATAANTAEVQAVRIMEDMGFNVLVEAAGASGSVFESYPSLTLGPTALAAGAAFDARPSHAGVLVQDVADEVGIPTWRADDRDVYGAWSIVLPGPWEGFGEYGEA